MAIRTWAWTHPHDYALLYGTPVPGYAAPDDTTVPGTRVSRALIRIVADALRDGRIVERPTRSERCARSSSSATRPTARR
jgi:hypothetical protein